MKAYKAFLATLVFLVVLLGIYWVHVNFFKVNVLFYSAIGDGVLATIVSAALLFSWRRFAVVGSFEKTLLCLIWLLGSYAFAISVPTLIDRSLSFYILEKIQQRGGGIRFDRFEEVFTKEYVKEHRLMDVRLTEQQESGTIVIDGNGCIRLTEWGSYIATASRYFRQHLLPKQRLLICKYSDDLTDPFRKSQPVPDYACK